MSAQPLHNEFSLIGTLFIVYLSYYALTWKSLQRTATPRLIKRETGVFVSVSELRWAHKRRAKRSILALWQWCMACVSASGGRTMYYLLDICILVQFENMFGRWTTNVWNYNAHVHRVFFGLNVMRDLKQYAGLVNPSCEQFHTSMINCVHNCLHSWLQEVRSNW